MRRRIFSLLTALALLLCMSLTAFAQEVPELDRDDCTISVTLTYGKEKDKIEGAELLLYRVGDVKEDDGNYSFVLSDAFKDSKLSLEKLDGTLAESLAKYAKNCTALKSVKTDKEGTALFDKLTPGLYLVVQEKGADGYKAINPFLVSVPKMENGKYDYTVDANPKVGEIVPEETAKPTQPPKPTEPTLPQTGQLNWPVPILAVAGLGLFVLGWGMRFGRKKEGYEE